MGEVERVPTGKEVFVQLGQEPAPHLVAEGLLEEDEARTLDRAEEPTFVEQQALVSELRLSTGFLLSDLAAPIWILGRESARPVGVSEPVPRENQTGRIRLQASSPPDLVLERLSNRTHDLETDSALVSIVVGTLSSMSLAESC